MKVRWVGTCRVGDGSGEEDKPERVERPDVSCHEGVRHQSTDDVVGEDSPKRQLVSPSRDCLLSARCGWRSRSHFQVCFSCDFVTRDSGVSV